MTSEPRLVGAVLAGGESRRFGSDKALAQIDGKTLTARARETLSAVFDEVVVVSSEGSSSVGFRRRVPDLRAGCGPLGGLEAALEWATREEWEGVFLLACDLPLVTTEVVRLIVRSMGPAAAAAPSREGTPPCEPLCAAYRGACLAPVRQLLDEGRLAVHEVLARVDTKLVEVVSDVFLNVNTQADRELAESILHSGER